MNYKERKAINEAFSNMCTGIEVVRHTPTSQFKEKLRRVAIRVMDVTSTHDDLPDTYRRKATLALSLCK